MSKQKSLSSPKIGMNRSTSPHLLSDNEFSFQLNGASYDEGGEKFNLTDEHSNILATKFKEGFKFIGGKNHVVRDKTYIFLTNPETNVSEIGCIRNTTDFSLSSSDTEIESGCLDCPEFVNTEAIPLEEQTQIPHQIYETLLEDSCNLCLGFDVNHPIIDIIIKEQNIGTKLFWTSTPGQKEFRYLELDDLERYKFTGEDNCGITPVETCLDCDKLRVFRLYTELKTKSYERTLGGNLKKGSYEVLGAYSDVLGNEFTSYVSLTPIIPIFDEANIIHEQEDNNAETNFSIKVELDNVDIRFDYYKIAVRYFTSKGVFTSFVESVHNTSDRSIIISDNEGKSINNTKLSLVKPFVETVDGATASNNILFLNGIREREPINLQPVINLAGLGVRWMSFRAKEDLYANADSYKYLGYNRDENVALSIDFGMKDGYRTNSYIFIPRPATTDELSDFTTQGDDYDSVTSANQDCDGNLRDKKWQFYNTAFEIGSCPLSENLPTVQVTEPSTVFTKVLESDGLPQIPSGTIEITNQLNNFTDLKSFIEDNQKSCSSFPYAGSAIEGICQYIDLSNLISFNSLPKQDSSVSCTTPILISESVVIEDVLNETIIDTNKELVNYSRIRPPEFCSILDDEVDENFSSQYALRFSQVSAQIEGTLTKRINTTYADTCQNSIELLSLSPSSSNNSTFSFVHPYFGAEQTSDNTSAETLYANALETKDALYTQSFSPSDIGGVGGVFLNKIHKGALWFKINVKDKSQVLVEITRLLDSGGSYWRLDGDFQRFKNRFIRVHFFHNCNSNTPISQSSYTDENGTTIYDNLGTNPSFGGIYSLSSVPELIPIDSSIINNPLVVDDFIYMVVDLPLSISKGLGQDNFINDIPQAPIIPTVVTVPLNSCFSVNTREVELLKKEVFFDEIKISKLQKYSFNCTYEIPLLKDCEPVPYKYGELGYFESTDSYPDNSELYDSSTLTINKNRITNTELLAKLDVYKQSETATEIILSDKADFRCKNVRHYKLPDNQVSPFIGTDNIASNSDSIISPLGFTIDGEIITNMLDVALDNGLLTQEQRNNIVDYKIYRADSTLDRSVVASGIVFNTKKYTVEGENIHYFNYPFNSLGADKYYPNNTDDNFDKMQAISPEFDYFRPSLPTEMSLQGFMFGKSNSRILPVENHSRMVILGQKAFRLAETLAILEVIAEGIIATAQSAEVYRIQFGFSYSANPVGIGLNIAVAALQLISSVVYKVGRYRLEWLRSFENLGAPYNFGYYLSAGSNYNYLKTLQTDGDRLRGLSVKKYLKSGMLNVSDPVSGEIIRINNSDREEAPFFSFGDYPINNLNSEYTSYDNSDENPNFSSQILSSEIGCHEGKSPEQLRNIASPYVAFKNYIPNQYGTVDSIKWIDTTYCIPITETGVCNGILGGDTFISRHSKKRKTRLFETDLLGSADLTPFPYKSNANYGDPRYYIDYKLNSEFTSSGEIFPDIFYDIQFDCNTSSNKFYIEPPGKFYLYNIAFTNFLCETRINTNFRNARKEPWNQFYPQNTDYESITQPTTVALTRQENYFYNRAYLQTNILNTVFTLPEYYSKENEILKAYNRNSVIYSLPDVNENSITEPWLLYRPNDKANLESTYGHLINMKGIESDQILLYFEDALQLQNSINKFTDSSTQYSRDLGDGGIFAKRAITLRTTDIGYGGTQSKQTLSCEFGHFHVDLKRGQVFNYIGGTDMKEISRYSNGKPNGMDVWFKEHLPLKFIKQFPNYSGVLDNPYNGIGIHWGYDSKYRRVILTKKDYQLAQGVTLNYDPETNTFDGDTTLQDQISNGNLIDISWTVTYKPETGSWESYMSYTPNYYINHTDYFQSGINSEDERHGLWSHLLTNKSYRVFYGQKFPYIIEYPIKNEYFSKRLESFNWNAQLRRYHNEYDYAVIEDNPFSSVTIYNNYENSGKLNLIKNTGALSQLSKYPITNSDNTQDILISYDNYKYNVDYFYNRVNSNKNNQPVWLWDSNQINKTINSKAVSFYGKKVLERLKGNFFMVRLERNGNTNYDLDFRWSEQLTNSSI